MRKIYKNAKIEIINLDQLFLILEKIIKILKIIIVLLSEQVNAILYFLH